MTDRTARRNRPFRYKHTNVLIIAADASGRRTAITVYDTYMNIPVWDMTQEKLHKTQNTLKNLTCSQIKEAQEQENKKNVHTDGK